MIPFAKFVPTFATIAEAREQTAREFDLIRQALALGVASSELAQLLPVVVAPGAAAVTITNAPAGSPATFARYLQYRVPGLPGVVTIGSLT